MQWISEFRPGPHTSRCQTSASQNTPASESGLRKPLSHRWTKIPGSNNSLYACPQGPLVLEMSLEVTAVIPTPSVSPSLPESGEKKVHGFSRASWVAETPDTHFTGCTVPGAALAADSAGSCWTSFRTRSGSPAPAALAHNGIKVPASNHTLHPRSLKPGAPVPPG